MAITHRFGKQFVSSTCQIRHELIPMWEADELKKSEARTAPLRRRCPLSKFRRPHRNCRRKE